MFFKQASKCCLKCCDNAWLSLVQNRFKNRSSREYDSRIPNSPRISSYRVFAVTSSFATRCSVDLTRIVVYFWFYISRFLLICQWGSLNLTYTFKWFFFLKNISEHHLRTVLGIGCFGCTLTKLQKRFSMSMIFSLIFFANVSEVFKQDFLMITWSKETSFDFEKLGEDCKSIFSKLYSPSKKPSIFRKWLILWKKSWAAFMRFCGWK